MDAGGNQQPGSARPPQGAARGGRRAPESALALDSSSLSPAAMQSQDIFLRFVFLSHPVSSRGLSSGFSSHRDSALLTYTALIPAAQQSGGKQSLGPDFYLTCSEKGLSLPSATALFHCFPFAFPGLHKAASIETGIRLCISNPDMSNPVLPNSCLSLISPTVSISLYEKKKEKEKKCLRKRDTFS